MITISLVEDDSDLRSNIAEFLRSTGKFACISGYTRGSEAVKKLPADSPQIVLMDIDLGEMSGIECVRTLKPLMPDTQFLMLTAFADTEKIFSALAAGASGYILKHHPPAMLLDALDELLAGGAPMSASIARKVVASFHIKNPGADKSAHNLSPREIEVLEGLAKGQLYKQLSDQMNISVDTVRTYIRRIYEKLHVNSRTEAVAKYLKQ